MPRGALEIDQCSHQFPGLLIVFMLAAVTRLANPKDFACTVDLFHPNALLGQLPIGLLLLFR